MKVTVATLGPIVDTFELVEKPAGLWAASYTFSWLCRAILENLLTAKDSCPDAKDVVSPAVALDESGNVKLNPLYAPPGATPDELALQGVGLLHDRIVVIGDHVGSMKTAIDKAIGTLAEIIADVGGAKCEEVKPWLREYLRIPAAVIELGSPSANPLTAAGKLISAMELEPSFPAVETVNHILSVFRNTDDAGSENAKVLKYRKRLIPEADDKTEWIVAKKENPSNPLSLEELAECNGYSPKDGRGEKYRNYYAVIQSDGDSLGALLRQLDQEGAKEFSRRAIVFAGTCANLVRQYGGMPIYAGGDDLLAIVPLFGCIEKKGMTVLGLVEEINKAFYKAFYDVFIKKAGNEMARQLGEDGPSRLDALPTLSFGISVQYKKSPLYEALEAARRLLENDAKTGKKNAVAIEVAKHSGQTHKFVIHGAAIKSADYGMSEGLKLLDKMILPSPGAAGAQQGEGDENETSKRLSSLAHIVEENRILFREAFNEPEDLEKRMETLVKNLLDNPNQRRYDEHVKDFGNLARIATMDEALGDNETRCDFLVAAMRLQQFMFEKVSEDEKDDDNGGDR